MIVRGDCDNGDEVTKVLTALAVDAVEDHRVLDRMLIVERANRPATSKLTHAMVVNGSPLPSDLGHVGDDENFSVEWVLPLSRTEAEYGRSKGTARLMLLLRWSDIDIFDLTRESVQEPTGIKMEAFARCNASDDSDNVCDCIIALVDGEPERGSVVDALLSTMRSSSEQVRQCATEAIEALARSEPESFSIAQADALETLLMGGLDLGEGAPAQHDALEAVRHARRHIVSH